MVAVSFVTPTESFIATRKEIVMAYRYEYALAVSWSSRNYVQLFIATLAQGLTSSKVIYMSQALLILWNVLMLLR